MPVVITGAMGISGFISLAGIVAAVFSAYFLAKKRGCYEDFIFDAVIACIPLSVIGARLGYVLEDVISPEGMHGWTFAAVLGVTGRGGMSLYGAIVAGSIGAAVLAAINRRLADKNPEKYGYRKVSFAQTADVAMCVLPLVMCVANAGGLASSGENMTAAVVRVVWYAVAAAVLIWAYAGRRKSFDGFEAAAALVAAGLCDVVVSGFDPAAPGIAGDAIKIGQIEGAAALFAGMGFIVAHLIGASKNGKSAFIAVDVSRLNDEYYGYDKSAVGKPVLRAPDDEDEPQFEETPDDDRYWETGAENNGENSDGGGDGGENG